MSFTDKDFDRLSSLLNAIPIEREGLSIGEFDGYVAALIVPPEMVPPSECVLRVWDSDGMFADVTDSEALVAAVMGHYNRVASELAEETDAYAPLLEVDTNGSELLWEPWINGFERCMRLRLDAWGAIPESDFEEAVASVSMTLAINALDCGKAKFDRAGQDEPHELAPQLIPEFVRYLNVWTKSRAPQGAIAASFVAPPRFGVDDTRPFIRKVGRYELSPCGSCRKYKRRCGAN